MMTEPSPPYGGDRRPSIAVIAQYIKDLSFESPRYLGSAAITNRTSEVSIAVDIGVIDIKPDWFEITVTLRAAAQFRDSDCLGVTLAYAGVFVLQDLPPEALAPTLYIVAPELLFPFMRKAINRLLSAAGLTEFLDRFDFAERYRQTQGERADRAAH